MSRLALLYTLRLAQYLAASGKFSKRRNIIDANLEPLTFLTKILSILEDIVLLYDKLSKKDFIA